MTPQHVTVPEHVSAVDLGPATVLLDYQTGEIKVLTGPSARWWTELAASGDTATPTALGGTSARTLLRQLHTAGLLVSAELPRPWPLPVAGRPIVPSWGTQEVQAGRVPTPPVPFRVLPVAGVALAVVLAVAHGGRTRARMARLTRLLRWAARRTIRPAPAERARQAVYAVRRAGMLAPGRVACLEFPGRFRRVADVLSTVSRCIRSTRPTVPSGQRPWSLMRHGCCIGLIVEWMCQQDFCRFSTIGLISMVGNGR